MNNSLLKLNKDIICIQRVRSRFTINGTVLESHKELKNAILSGSLFCKRLATCSNDITKRKKSGKLTLHEWKKINGKTK